MGHEVEAPMRRRGSVAQSGGVKRWEELWRGTEAGGYSRVFLGHSRASQRACRFYSLRDISGRAEKVCVGAGA